MLATLLVSLAFAGPTVPSSPKPESAAPSAPADASPFCRGLFAVIDDYGSMFANLRGAQRTEAEFANASFSTYHVKSPIPGFEREFVTDAQYWSRFNRYEATIRSNLSREDAQQVFDGLRQQILDCTGPPKEPKHERRFVPMLVAAEALPTVDYLLLGIDDDTSPYARKNFRMVLRVVPSPGDASGARFDVTLKIDNLG